jgi:protein-tyrosine-phosphatase
VKNILFVCTGNTCRSPLAEYLLRHKAGQIFEVQSAGVATVYGGPIAAHVEQLLVEKGIQTEHVSQYITPELMEWADLVLTMTQGHQQQLVSLFPEKIESIHTLKQYVRPGSGEADVIDPFGGSLGDYQETMHELEYLLELLIDKNADK